MQTKRTVDGARTPQSPESTLITLPAVARRATARRASAQRATARDRTEDVEARIFEYLKDHPPRTAGDVTDGQAAD